MEKYNIIKRTIPLLAMLLCLSVSISAQTGLHVEKVFTQFGHIKGSKMVELHDTQFKGYQLHVYKSLSYKKIGDKIETYLKEDKKKARKIREVVENGRITSGYYMMQPLENGMNRFILFSHLSRGNGAIIYIEGRLGPDDIITLCYARHR